ncbi:MAG: FkbM family methyltransferase, partial [Candidatus Woesearchaeota archaeon]
IEGYEYNAILGAEKTIKKYKPVLSISLYHTPRDFFEIPKLLKQWVPEYKMRFLNLNPLSPILERTLLAYVE